MEKKNIDFYLYKNSKDSKNMLLSKTDNGHIKMKINTENDENKFYNYVLNIIRQVGKARFFTNNITFNDEQTKELYENANVLHIKNDQCHPEEFNDFLNNFEIESKKEKKGFISVNIFDYNDHDFIAFEIKMNELKKTLTKRIRKKATSNAKIAANLLKDIIPKYIDKEATLTIKSADKSMLDELKKIIVDEKYSYFNHQIRGFDNVFFDSDNVIKENTNRLDVLITNHEYDKKIQNEVIADYDEIANPNKLVIYTDSSTHIDKKKKINDSGMGIVIKQDGIDELIAVVDKKFEPSPVSCFDANHSEGYAILNALKFVVEKNLIDKDTIIEVRSDSLSNIRKLNNIEDSYFICEEIKDYCQKEIPNIPVAFKWVKGHASNVYNIMVDELASKSLFNDNYDFNTDLFFENIHSYQNRNKSLRKMRP